MNRTIGKLANELGVNIETIRFYERKGLIQQPLRPEQGYRHYPDESLNRIRFIKQAQGLGFTLEEIAHLLSLHDNPCGQVQELAEKKLVNVKNKITDLLKLEKALNGLLSQCQSNRDNTHCPIIESLLS